MHKKSTTKLKMWVGLGVVATLGATAGANAREGATPDSHPGQFHGDFNAALSQLLAGEGGESGVGLSKMWPTVTAPALTGGQIKKVVSGNSLTIEHHYTMQFDPSGSVGGYQINLTKSDAKNCPKAEVLGDAWLMHEGTCYSRVKAPWSGKWRIEEHQLCVDLKSSGGDRKDCWHVVMLLDRIALFDPSGNLFGKGNTLKEGKAIDE